MTVRSLAPADSGRCRALPVPVPGRQPLEPLAAALASGRARFGGSPVTVPGPGSRGVGRLSRKVAGIFAAFPAVSVGDWGVVHSIGRTHFVELALAGSGHLVACR